jgi:YVTN family beta-propeller protein
MTAGARARHRDSRRFGSSTIGIVLGTLVGLAVGALIGATALRGQAAGAMTGSHGKAVASKASAEATAQAPRLNGRPPTAALSGVAAGPPSDLRRLALLRQIGGPISPNSVAASGAGLVFAQNMAYRHTVTVYDSSGQLVRTIPDSVLMSAFGIPGHPGVTRGAPTDAAFTPDGQHVYVSNHAMYGAGFGRAGHDSCPSTSAEAAGGTSSYVYRISTRSLAIDQVIRVGLVPQSLAVTPNGTYLLVSDWCSSRVNVVDVAAQRRVATIPVGLHPLGLAVTPDSTYAFVAVTGPRRVVRIDLRTLKVSGGFALRSSPRQLVIAPNGRYLFASLTASGEVVKVRLSDCHLTARRHTGIQARSLAIAADGRSLYVANYASSTVTKVRASDLRALQTVRTGAQPIGITYDATTGFVWVAVSGGKILVLGDRSPT